MFYSETFIDTLITESQAILAEDARIDTSPYETINDASPKGRGVWTFCVNKYPRHPADYATLEQNDAIDDIQGDFQDACKKAIKRWPDARVIYLLP